jgi:hypothetical protein
MVIRKIAAGCLKLFNLTRKRLSLSPQQNRHTPTLQCFVDLQVGTFIASSQLVKSITEIVLHMLPRLPGLFAFQLL